MHHVYIKLDSCKVNLHELVFLPSINLKLAL
jgi:hypothetical protein